MENTAVCKVVKAFAFGKLVKSQILMLQSPFRLDGKNFIMMASSYVILLDSYTKCFLKGLQVADPVHRHSSFCIRVILLWPSCRQLPVPPTACTEAVCLLWSLLGGSMSLWSVSCPLLSTLLLGAFSCSSVAGLISSHVVVGAQFFRTLNASLVCRSSAFSARVATCSLSCLSPHLPLSTPEMPGSSHAHLFWRAVPR